MDPATPSLDSTTRSCHTEAREHRDTEPCSLPRVLPTDTSIEGRVKRLTLDLSVDLHRALKVRAAELDVPMAELLRALIQRALRDPATLDDLAEGLRGGQ